MVIKYYLNSITFLLQNRICCNNTFVPQVFICLLLLGLASEGVLGKKIIYNRELFEHANDFFNSPDEYTLNKYWDDLVFRKEKLRVTSTEVSVYENYDYDLSEVTVEDLVPTESNYGSNHNHEHQSSASSLGDNSLIIVMMVSFRLRIILL